MIQTHKGAFSQPGPAELEAFGQGINSWWTVDAFARTISGLAWHKGQVPDRLIHAWARSQDLLWRRAALVSTVVWKYDPIAEQATLREHWPCSLVPSIS